MGTSGARPLPLPPCSETPVVKRLSLVLPLILLGACSDDDDGPRSIAASLDGLGLDTLLQAVQAAGLDDELADPMASLTLFAPSDDAFDQLPPGTLAFLLDPANQALLVDVLELHVLASEVDAATASGLTSASSLGGESIWIDQVGGELFLNDARVVRADLRRANGIIHEIDRVLLPAQDLVTTLADRGFDTLLTAVQAAELDDDLAAPGPFTVLAPTDAAFAALPAGVLDALLEPANQAELVAILGYHVLPQSTRASDALAAETAATLLGPSVLFAEDGGIASVNGVQLAAFNIPCTNGVVHVLDAVLLPPEDIPTLASDLGFDTLVTALQAAELDDDLAAPAGPFTVFAPTDEAFEALPPGVLAALLEPANQADLVQVLSYHVVAGELTATEVLAAGSLTTLEGSDVTITSPPAQVDGANLVALDVLASNGIVHAIDAVLLPPGFVPPMTAPATRSPQADLEPGAARDADADELAVLEMMLDDGPAAVPAWAAGARAVAAGWQRLERAGPTPLAPDALGSADSLRLLVETPGARAAAPERLAPALPRRVRLDARAEAVPYELVLQVRGAALEGARLRLATEAGVEELVPDELRTLAAGERLALWRPARAGWPSDGYDVILETPAGARLEAIRILALR